MILTLHTEFVTHGGDALKQMAIKVKLPNNDAYHLFEAWVHLGRCNEWSGDAMDIIMNDIYEIVSESAKKSLGLNDAGFREGNWDIEDPMVHNRDEMSAIIYVHV